MKGEERSAQKGRSARNAGPHQQCHEQDGIQRVHQDVHDVMTDEVVWEECPLQRMKEEMNGGVVARIEAGVSRRVEHLDQRFGVERPRVGALEVSEVVGYQRSTQRRAVDGEIHAREDQKRNQHPGPGCGRTPR
jgi:hypothetical protein